MSSKHGRRKGSRGAKAPLDFEIFSKKRLFFQFRGVKKQISPLLAPLEKNFGKIPYWPPLEKILLTPMPLNELAYV